MNVHILWFVVGVIAYILFAIRCIKVDNMELNELFYPKLTVIIVWVLFILGGFISLLYVILVYTFRYVEGRKKDEQFRV